MLKTSLQCTVKEGYVVTNNNLCHDVFSLQGTVKEGYVVIYRCYVTRYSKRRVCCNINV